MRATAHYVDGRTAARHVVEIELGAGRLSIIRDSATLAHWPLGELRGLDESARDRPLRLKCGDDGGERLSISDERFIAALLRSAPHLARPWRHPRTWRRVAAWTAGVLGFILVAGLGTIYVPAIAADLVPVAWEEELGDRVVAIVTDELGGSQFCATADGERALARLVERLLDASGTRYTPLVRVADSAQINAFAAPGGRIIVLRGLLDEARSADEVAGVLAHELGHMLERHPTEGVIRAIGMDLIVTAMFGDSFSVGGLLAQAGSVLAILSYSRRAEAEADRLAIDMLNRAGIRGDGLADFFARAGPDHDPGGYFSTHPSNRERAEQVRALATGAGPALSPAEWQALKAICRGGTPAR